MSQRVVTQQIQMLQTQGLNKSFNPGTGFVQPPALPTQQVVNDEAIKIATKHSNTIPINPMYNKDDPYESPLMMKKQKSLAHQGSKSANRSTFAITAEKNITSPYITQNNTDKSQIIQQAYQSLQTLQTLDQTIKQQYIHVQHQQQMKVYEQQVQQQMQQIQLQHYMQLYQMQAQQYQYQLEQQQNQEEQERRRSEELENQEIEKLNAERNLIAQRIKAEAEREMTKIRKAAEQLRQIEGGQEARRAELLREQERLRMLDQEVRERERQSERERMKAEIERDNLKQMHQMIDTQESMMKSRMSPIMVMPQHMYHPLSQYPPQQQSQCFNCSTRSEDKAATNNSRSRTLRPVQNYLKVNPYSQNDDDLNDRSYETHQSYEDQKPQVGEQPVFKLNSVMDWLDHRKYHNQQHQVKLKQNFQKSVAKLEEHKREVEAKQNDWAGNKIDRLSKLIQGKQLGGLEGRAREKHY